MSTRRCSSVSPPVATFEASTRSPTRRDIWVIRCSTMPCTRGSSNSSAAGRPSIAAAMRMGAIGLRNSSVTAAINADCRCRASSAAAFSSCAESAASTSFSLASRNSAYRRSASAPCAACVCSDAGATGAAPGRPWASRRWRLLSYMAASARAIKVSTSSPSSGYSAMPMLTVTTTVRPSSSAGARIAAINFSATTRASPGWSSSSSRTRNSSPPWRPTVSTARTTDRIRSATRRSTLSPNACPCVSFSGLKSSMSTNNRARREPWRLAWAIASMSRSISVVRFGNCVRPSSVAAWCALSSVCAIVSASAWFASAASTNCSLASTSFSAWLWPRRLSARTTSCSRRTSTACIASNSTPSRASLSSASAIDAAVGSVSGVTGSGPGTTVQSP